MQVICCETQRELREIQIFFLQNISDLSDNFDLKLLYLVQNHKITNITTFFMYAHF